MCRDKLLAEKLASEFDIEANQYYHLKEEQEKRDEEFARYLAQGVQVIDLDNYVEPVPLTSTSQVVKAEPTGIKAEPSSERATASLWKAAGNSNLAKILATPVTNNHVGAAPLVGQDNMPSTLSPSSRIPSASGTQSFSHDHYCRYCNWDWSHLVNVYPIEMLQTCFFCLRDSPKLQGVEKKPSFQLFVRCKACENTTCTANRMHTKIRMTCNNCSRVRDHPCTVLGRNKQSPPKLSTRKAASSASTEYQPNWAGDPTGIYGDPKVDPVRIAEQFLENTRELDERYQLSSHGEDRVSLKEMLTNIRPDEDVHDDDDAHIPGMAPQVCLMKHQIKGVSWMRKMEEGSNKGGILADDMGLGKTVQALSIMVSRPSPPGGAHLPSLIVVPVALLHQWESEISNKDISPLTRLYPSWY